ncbi:MAG: hypothetical protein JWQ71_4453 [Pedosphaera sp.]|nr:hypothetical protein [Pedosphaera sp.]
MAVGSYHLNWSMDNLTGSVECVEEVSYWRYENIIISG